MRLNRAIERLAWLSLKLYVQIASPFAQVKKWRSSAEVEALAPVFEKSATELKHKNNKNIKALYI